MPAVGVGASELMGMRDMTTGWTRAAVALAGSAALLSSESMALSSGECAALSVQVRLPEASSAECESGNVGGGGDQGSGSDELIRIISGASILIVSHAHVGRHTYLRRLSVKDIIGNFRGFDSVDDWGEERESGDFTVRPFRARMSSGSGMACFGFSLYSGHVARTTGYRHHIGGFYCDFGGLPVTDARIDEVVGSIEYNF
jgi:hypothetical protein